MIDANGSRFDLLLGRADWGRCRLDVPAQPTLVSLWDDPARDEAAPLSFDPRDSHLILSRRASRFQATAEDVPPAPAMRLGAAADASGNVYAIVDAGARIEVRSAGSGQIGTFWPPAAEPDPTPSSPASGDFAPSRTGASAAGDAQPAPHRMGGLAVTRGQYLVAGFVREAGTGGGAPCGLLLFDLLGGGPPLELAWPEAWHAPILDMAPRPCGGVALLSADHRVGLLDRQMAMGGVPTQPEGPWFALQTTAMGGGRPVAIEVLPDGGVLVLDSAGTDGFALVSLYRAGALIAQASTRDIVGVFPPSDLDGFTWRGFDFAWHAQTGGSAQAPVPRLVVVSDEGNQAVTFEVLIRGEHLQLAAQPDFLPLRRYGGMRLVTRGRAQVEGDTGLLYRSDQPSPGRWLPLVEQRRPRHVTQAALLTPVLDAGEAACVWHRVMVDATVPPGCRVRIASRCSDDPALLASLPFSDEPGPMLRPDGSELPWLLDAPGSRTDTARGQGTWELLLQACQGRWLQLRLTLEGNELATPRVGALRVWRPRFSYLQRYLPAVYREDAGSAHFLERFLALFEGPFTALEDRIATASALFDVRSAPADTLDWLASWLGLVLDPSLDEARRRQLIRHAVRLFQYRGTPQAVRLATQLAVSPCVPDADFNLPTPSQDQPWGVRVVEAFQTRQLPPALLGETTLSDEPRTLTGQAERWSLQEGAEGLQRRWQAWLKATAPATAATGAVPAFAPLPQAGVPLPVWRGFCEATLGSVPELAQALDTAWRNRPGGAAAATPLPQSWPEGDDAAARQQRQDWRDFVAALPPRLARPLRRWQAFLARRHLRIARYRAIGGGAWPSFDLVPPPTALPTHTPLLADWCAFETRVAPISERAHSFSVLLPISGPTDDLESINRQVDLAHRVVNLEKPAHTRFDVRPYWTLFRLGQVRLGLDTLLGEGSREAGLAAAMVLGQGHIGASRTASRREVPPDRILLEC